MVKEIIWSLQAQKDRKEILHFWRIHNQSDTYSKKLNHVFKKAVQILSEHPHIGRRTELENVRVKVVKNYLIIYKETENRIEVLTIWDSKRNDEELKNRLK